MDARSVYLTRKDHINAHFFICFIALIIARIVEIKLTNKYAIKKILKSLRSVSCSHMDTNHYLFDYVDDVTDDARLCILDYISFDEKYIKRIMLSYFMLSKMYMVKSEYEVESGYIDIALLRREPIDPDYFAIFEVKYIKKSEYEAYGEKIVEEKKNEAVAQILRYNESNELKSLSNLKKWVIVFAGDKCFANVEI